MGGKSSKPSAGKGGSKPTTQVTKPGELTEADYQFLTSTTGLSKVEIINIHTQFMQGNPDGKLDRQEFIKLYDKLRPEPPEALDEISVYIFKVFDKDKSGSITFQEFMMAFALTTRGDPKTKLEYAFGLYDSDNNGYLTSAEVKEVLYGMLDMLGADRKMDSSSIANDCFTKLDVNKDGKVSKDEFINGLLSNYHLRSLMSPFN